MIRQSSYYNVPPGHHWYDPLPYHSFYPGQNQWGYHDDWPNTNWNGSWNDNWLSNNNWSHPNWNDNSGNNNWHHNYWGDYNWINWQPPTGNIALTDYGSSPFVVNMEAVTRQNNTFRTALWTGEHLQLTLMSIEAGDDIGLERHTEHDQFIRIEEGEGLVQMGDSRDAVDFQERVHADDAIFIPAGKWHNLTNTGNRPIKLYSIYAPPEHPFGTMHETSGRRTAAEENYDD